MPGNNSFPHALQVILTQANLENTCPGTSPLAGVISSLGSDSSIMERASGGAELIYNLVQAHSKGLITLDLSWNEQVTRRRVVVRMRLRKEEKPRQQETQVPDKGLKAQQEEKLGGQDGNDTMWVQGIFCSREQEGKTRQGKAEMAGAVKAAELWVRCWALLWILSNHSLDLGYWQSRHWKGLRSELTFVTCWVESLLETWSESSRLADHNAWALAARLLMHLIFICFPWQWRKMLTRSVLKWQSILYWTLDIAKK